MFSFFGWFVDLFQDQATGFIWEMDDENSDIRHFTFPAYHKHWNIASRHLSGIMVDDHSCNSSLFIVLIPDGLDHQVSSYRKGIGFSIWNILERAYSPGSIFDIFVPQIRVLSAPGYRRTQDK